MLYMITLGTLSVLMTLDGVPKEGLRIEDVLVRLGQLQVIEEKVYMFFHFSTWLLFSV